MSFKRKIARRQGSDVVASEPGAEQIVQAPPQLAVPSTLVWDVAMPRAARYAPVHADRGRMVARRTPGKASGHR